jgi:hypothetical protein
LTKGEVDVLQLGYVVRQEASTQSSGEDSNLRRQKEKLRRGHVKKSQEMARNTGFK